MLQAYRQHAAERAALGIPPLPLTQGYGPIAQAVAQLPPSTIGEARYRFALYRTVERQGAGR